MVPLVRLEQTTY